MGIASSCYQLIRNYDQPGMILKTAVKFGRKIENFNTAGVSNQKQQLLRAWKNRLKSSSGASSDYFRLLAEVNRMKQMLADPNLTIEQVQLEIPFSLVVTTQLWHRQFITHFDARGSSRAS